MNFEKVWLKTADLAAMNLPCIPTSRRGVIDMMIAENWCKPENEGRSWRRIQDIGGEQFEFTPFVLPSPAQAALALQLNRKVRQPKGKKNAALWSHYDSLPDHLKKRAKKALKVLNAIALLTDTGISKTVAVAQVSISTKTSRTTINNWQRKVAGVHRCDWLAALAPHWAGGGKEVETDQEAWELLKADYLRLERPSFAACYRRLKLAAGEQGWTLASPRTLKRRLEALSPQITVLLREGEEALKKMFPAQKRDHSVFHALQAVNADGHRFDVFVKWPEYGNGRGEIKIVRPVLVAFQDIYSGKILSWRIDATENKEAVRLAFGDLVERYGIPDYCLLDNGRNFASKWLTGGTPNRYRFKVKEEEPLGILPQLGVEVHWATPYSGRSKPIERAFRDLASDLAKHPSFAGAYTGNNPTAKPENYGSKAVDLDVFLDVVSEGIKEHNAREGRRSDVCRGVLSFDQAFQASYAQSVITRATEEQRRLWLLAAEKITVSSRDGTITLEGNRFWAEFLHQIRGQSVIVRFDPQQIQADLHVYRVDGTYLGQAECVQPVGFNDAAAAQAHARTYTAFKKAAKEKAKAEVKLNAEEVARILGKLPQVEEELITTKTVRPLFAPKPALRGNAALEWQEDDDEEDFITQHNRLARPDRVRSPLKLVEE